MFLNVGLLSFLLSLFFCLCLIKLNSSLSKKGIINLRESKQTFHKKSTSRLGGVAILFAVAIPLIISGLNLSNSIVILVVIYSLSAFLSGLIDDLNIGNSPTLRLAALAPVPVLFFYFTNLKILGLDIPYIDTLFKNEFFALAFLVFAIVGMINAFNIIDGFNGLFGTYCLLIIFALHLKETLLQEDFFYLNDYHLFLNVLMGSLIGFMVLNIFGKIFMGDAGAYFLGAILCWLVIHQYVMSNSSPWSVMLIFIYPFVEVVFSIIRKVFFRNMSAMQPDGLHFHMLVYKRITKRLGFKKIRLRHLLTTTIINFINLPFLLIATIAHDQTIVLATSCLIFFTIYTILYLTMLPKSLFKGMK